jgi:hypothetical protein
VGSHRVAREAIKHTSAIGRATVLGRRGDDEPITVPGAGSYHSAPYEREARALAPRSFSEGAHTGRKIPRCFGACSGPSGDGPSRKPVRIQVGIPRRPRTVALPASQIRDKEPKQRRGRTSNAQDKRRPEKHRQQAPNHKPNSSKQQSSQKGTLRSEWTPLPLFRPRPPLLHGHLIALSINKNGTIHARLKALQLKNDIARATGKNNKRREGVASHLSVSFA